MREIKFRAWDSEKNKMVFWNLKTLTGYDDMAVYIDSTVHDNIDNPKYTHMQYTGLKDKNGFEIYEGDIVKHGTYDICSCGNEIKEKDVKIDEVKWSEVVLGWYLGEQKMLYIANHHGSYVEIIGNIYENPELIGK